MAKPKRSPVKVTRAFLLGLANRIYDPKTRLFLHLCDGVLQNGPDPTDDERPMHCGLGELYFAMTGRQPFEDLVTEGDVINLAVRLSPLEGLAEANRQIAIQAIKKCGLSKDFVEAIVDQIHDVEDEDLTCEEEFRQTLDEIPDENDDGCGDTEDDNVCTVKTYRARAARVAKILRKAADILPE